MRCLVGLKDFRVNDRIRAREVLVIDDEGVKLGAIKTPEALNIADEKGLDLVEVAPNANPPVCRLMDYGKFKYDQKKKERQSRDKQHTVEVKEIRLRPKTDKHDIDVKVRKTRRFLESGDKVILTCFFRGRENIHPERGELVLNHMMEQLEDLAKIESPARHQGNRMSMTLAPLAKH
ncbi:MAG: translation initiation factor IF-3 [Planctomycetota bacterium]|nr:translation initiation factor IF-3 [Planctomycetota bacterium]